VVDVKPFVWRATKTHSQPSCSTSKNSIIPLHIPTYCLVERGRLFVRFPLLSLQSLWNLHVHQTINVFRFLQNDHERVFPILTALGTASQYDAYTPTESSAPRSPKGRFGRESSCCVSFCRRLGTRAWVSGPETTGKKASRSGILCTSNLSNLDLHSLSLSLPIGGYVHAGPSVFYL
jgi:hypothetical protein